MADKSQGSSDSKFYLLSTLLDCLLSKSGYIRQHKESLATNNEPIILSTSFISLLG